jgi:hypothetical protein
MQSTVKYIGSIQEKWLRRRKKNKKITKGARNAVVQEYKEKETRYARINISNQRCGV